jgi:hypothetical protein
LPSVQRRTVVEPADPLSRIGTSHSIARLLTRRLRATFAITQARPLLSLHFARQFRIRGGDASKQHIVSLRPKTLCGLDKGFWVVPWLKFTGGVTCVGTLGKTWRQANHFFGWQSGCRKTVRRNHADPFLYRFDRRDKFLI